jgi:hypothetical protein
MIRIADIQATIARNFDVPLAVFQSKCRDRHVARPRQIAMLLSREMTPLSLPAIGREFHRDHTTVIHGIREAKKRIAADPRLALKMQSIRFVLSANNTLGRLERILGRITDPSARKTVIMSKWERGEISSAQAKHLIRAGGLESA